MKHLFSTLAIIFGVLALIGWQWDISILTRLLAEAPPINPLTALGLILLGLEVTRLRAGSKDKSLEKTCFLIILLLVILTGMKLSDLLISTSFNVDVLLFQEKFFQTNKMSSAEALALFLLGLSVIALHLQSGSSQILAQSLAVFSSLISTLTLIGYAYGIPGFYLATSSAPMAFNAAISLLLLVWPILMAHADKGLMKYVVNAGPAGKMAALLLPAVVLVPFIFGWFEISGLRLGIIEAEFGVALAVVLNIAMLFSLTFFSATRLFALDNARKKAENDLRYMASYDSLTNLLNRRAFVEQIIKRIDLSRRHKDPHYAVIYLDLDGFKKVNDNLGHNAGDHLLKEVATLLSKQARESDTVARMGGDEFTVLLERIRDPLDVVHFVERVQNSVNKTFEHEGKEFRIGISAGIALGQSHYTSPDQILHDADSALYKAKAAGKGGYVLAN